MTGGTFSRLLMLVRSSVDINADDGTPVPPLADSRAALYAHVIGTGSGGDPEEFVMVGDNADAVAAAASGLLPTRNVNMAFNGATFDRLRTASAAVLALFSGLGALIVGKPGNWAIQNTPALGAKATISRAAVAGTRHVCTGFTVSLADTAASGILLATLRDGATGAGTILWQGTLACVAGGSASISVSDLCIPGSVNTAMTLEFAAAGTGTSQQSVSLQGYDAT